MILAMLETREMQKRDATAIVIGLAMGVPIGILFGNVATGIAIGLVFAIALGAFSRRAR